MSDIIYGIHAIEALFAREPERVLAVYAIESRTDQRITALLQTVKQCGIAQHVVDRKWLDDKTQSTAHQGIMASIKPGKQYHETMLLDLLAQHKTPFVLVLDGVTDPHNLGACLRSAEAAGVHMVIVPKDRSAPLSAIAKKVACGAAESIPLIRVTNLARTLRVLQSQHIWIIGTSGDATRTLYDTSIRGAVALVMGAEDKGIRRLTKEHCDELVAIPMLGTVSSLNVSVATGVCLFEIVRQRYISGINSL